jgi:MFS family permease
MTTPQRRRLRQVAVAVVSGQAIEYYDFLLYGSAAALVFGPTFFPARSAAASTAQAFGTFAIGFVMRPVGAVLFGHLGDRIGRRRTLLATLLIMGTATTLIGTLPTHHQVGVAAPIALIVLRCLPGLSMGGEWGGAALLAVEHAPRGRRTFWGSLPQMGSPIGLLSSTLILLAVSQLPTSQFHAWGWRIPFLLTAGFMVVGVRARLRVMESPEFEAAIAQRSRTMPPLLNVVRTAPAPIAAGLLAATVTTAGYYLVNTYTIAYSIDELGLDRDVGLYGQIVTGALQLALVPVVGAWAIRRSPRWLSAISALLVAAWAFPLYALIDTGIPAAIWLAQAVATVFLTGVWALLPEILAAQFPAEARYTGISLSMQGASILGGVAPYVATRLVDLGNGAPWLVGALLCAVGLMSAAGLLWCTRTYSDDAGGTAVPPQRRLPLTDRVAQELA